MIDGWVVGVDVSAHHRPSACDWARARDAGVDFVYAKLSEGRDWLDRAVLEHVRRIRAAGLRVGVFHFARPDNRFGESPRDGVAAGAREAAWMLRCLGDAKLERDDLPPALDLEKYTTAPDNAWRRDFVRGFVDTIEAGWGRVPVLYTGPNFWRYQLPREFAAELRGRGVPLWMVNYTADVDPTLAIPALPWTWWQYSGSEAVAHARPIPGLPFPVDVNRYRGTLAELDALGRGPRV